MSAVTVIAKPDLTGKRLAFALAEDRIGHYAEFRAFFVRTFDLDRFGLAEPGYVQAPSGLTLRAGVHRAERRAISFRRRTLRGGGRAGTDRRRSSMSIFGRFWAG